ncbi:MAG: beta-galactosidase [Actinobacteria bacterium]|nr:beta-galactosidase [Actinomycetota bacterium]
MRRLLSAALLLLALVGSTFLLAQESTTPAAAAATPRVAKAPKGFFGIVPQNALNEQEVEYMKAGGIEAIRAPLIWPAIQPTKKGAYNWGAFDPVVEEAARQGLSVLPFVIATPKWLAKKETTLPIGNATQRKAYVNFLRAAVERYGPGGQFWVEHSPSKIREEQAKEQQGPVYELPGARLKPIPKPVPIKTWQIWNEANFFYFAFPVDPIGYAKLLKLSTPVIKRAEPGAKVILTGLFGRPNAGKKRGMPAAQFLERVYSVPGIKNYFDGVALHPYAINSAQLEEIVEELHDVTTENRDRVPLYITEMGWGSQNDFHINAFEHGVRGQVEELQKAYAYLLANRNRLDLKQVYWFSWKDLPESCAFCDSVGLFHFGPKFKPKPAWRAFVKITGGKPRP